MSPCFVGWSVRSKPEKSNRVWHQSKSKSKLRTRGEIGRPCARGVPSTEIGDRLEGTPSFIPEATISPAVPVEGADMHLWLTPDHISDRRAVFHPLINPTGLTPLLA